MNFRMIGQVIGRVLCIEAALMLLPMVAALAYGETPAPFLITIAVTGGIGLAMWRVRAKSGGMTARDGFLIVGLSWIAMSLFGALLFVLTGDIPNYIDALFETISGLTTTGASVVTSPESMTRGGMFWRLFTHWIGGMGILVFVLAVLPMSGNRSMHIMRAEVPGPTVGKLVPRIRKTASILYLLYIALTLVETVLLIAGGMSFYDALLHAFATAGTGGLKVSRVMLLFKSCTIEVKKMLRPRCVENVRLDGKPVDGQTVYNAMTFFTFYIIILLIAGLIVSLDGLDFTTNFTAALSCLSNVGPGLSLVGPTGSFAIFSPLSKIVLMICMLLGRLEIFPLLLLFVPFTWRWK